MVRGSGGVAESSGRHVGRLPRSSNAGLPHDELIPWVRGKNWRTGAPVWVPYELVSTDYTLPLLSGTGHFNANTNGLASGNCALEAVLHGLCELIERDATALWWRRSPKAKAARALDLDRLGDRACRWVLERYADADIKVAVWDTTTDVGVASFLCGVYGRDPPLPEFGAGCHPSRDIALLRALTEAAQARTTFIAGSRDDIGRNPTLLTSGQRDWVFFAPLWTESTLQCLFVMCQRTSSIRSAKI